MCRVQVVELIRSGTIKEGADETADITLDMNNDVFFKLIDGSTSTAAAYMSGRSYYLIFYSWYRARSLGLLPFT